jgi:hypothetical protein
MKKYGWLFLVLSVLTLQSVYAADSTTVTTGNTANSGTTNEADLTADAPTDSPAAAAEAVAPKTEAATDAAEAINQENLEFVSGEVSASDEANKTITVKLYGETEDEATDKVLTIKIDETTDITDGEKDRDIKSLTVGTEVDVEYDPASNKATYIFVY